MHLSQRTHYAILALFELARRADAELGHPISISAIAEARSIPKQFLQTILRELKRGGFVESRRGKEGGYLLSRSAREVSVGEVVRFLEGEIAPLDGVDRRGNPTSAEIADCPCLPVWSEVARAMNTAYDRYTFAGLVQWDLCGKQPVVDFAI